MTGNIADDFAAIAARQRELSGGGDAPGRGDDELFALIAERERQLDMQEEVEARAFAFPEGDPRRDALFWGEAEQFSQAARRCTEQIDAFHPTTVRGAVAQLELAIDEYKNGDVEVLAPDAFARALHALREIAARAES
jgi:hypothetical protein